MSISNSHGSKNKLKMLAINLNEIKTTDGIGIGLASLSNSPPITGRANKSNQSFLSQQSNKTDFNGKTEKNRIARISPVVSSKFNPKVYSDTNINSNKQIKFSKNAGTNKIKNITDNFMKVYQYRLEEAKKDIYNINSYKIGENRIPTPLKDNKNVYGEFNVDDLVEMNLEKSKEPLLNIPLPNQMKPSPEYKFKKLNTLNKLNPAKSREQNINVKISKNRIEREDKLINHNHNNIDTNQKTLINDHPLLFTEQKTRTFNTQRDTDATPVRRRIRLDSNEHESEVESECNAIIDPKTTPDFTKEMRRKMKSRTDIQFKNNINIIKAVRIKSAVILNFKNFLKLYSKKEGVHLIFKIFLFLTNSDIKAILNSGKRARLLIYNVVYESSSKFIDKIKLGMKNYFQLINRKLVFTKIKGI